MGIPPFDSIHPRAYSPPLPPPASRGLNAGGAFTRNWTPRVLCESSIEKAVLWAITAMALVTLTSHACPYSCMHRAGQVAKPRQARRKRWVLVRLRCGRERTKNLTASSWAAGTGRARVCRAWQWRAEAALSQCPDGPARVRRVNRAESSVMVVGERDGATHNDTAERCQEVKSGAFYLWCMT